MSVLREEKEEIIQKKNNFWIGLKKDSRNKQSSKKSLTDIREAIYLQNVNRDKVKNILAVYLVQSWDESNTTPSEDLQPHLKMFCWCSPFHSVHSPFTFYTGSFKAVISHN